MKEIGWNCDLSIFTIGRIVLSTKTNEFLIDFHRFVFVGSLILITKTICLYVGNLRKYILQLNILMHF